MNLMKNWHPIIEKFCSKLSQWKTKNLSFGGRLTLTKAVLGSLPIYYLSIFKAPLGVIESLERIRQQFLWGGSNAKPNIHWVKWSKILASKENGGLGIGSLRAFNLALLEKWRWRLKLEQHDLWCKVIRNIHNLVGKPSSFLSNKAIPGTWNNIAKALEDLQNLGMDPNLIFTNVIGDGRELQFWKDTWYENCSFQISNLYKLERRKSCVIADRVGQYGHSSLVFRWRRNPNSVAELSELQELSIVLRGVSLHPGNDKLRFSLASDGIFTVELLRSEIDKKIVQGSADPMEWISIVPKKIQCFVWRAKIGRIPTCSALRRRGIPLDSVLCKLCSMEEESCDHLLVECPFSRNCWVGLLNWCNISPVPFVKVQEVIDFAASWGNCPKKRSILLALCYGLLWLIWKARNNLVFNKKAPASAIIVDNLASLQFIWLKHRGRHDAIK